MLLKPITKIYKHSLSDLKKREPGLPALFLDRDGVIVEEIGYIDSPTKLVLVPGIVALINEIQHKAHIIVITNQSGIARGMFSEQQLDEIHNTMNEMLCSKGAFLDAIYSCPHLDDITDDKVELNCPCRKPKPGMFKAAQDDFSIDLKASWMIGDSARDIEAAFTAGVANIIRLKRGTASSEQINLSAENFITVATLEEAARQIQL